MSDELPKTLSFEGNVSERNIGALMVGGVRNLHGWPCLFVFIEKKRPDDIKVKVVLEIQGYTRRQERIFKKALKDAEDPVCTPPWKEGVDD